jgi:TatD DNase family protein
MGGVDKAEQITFTDTHCHLDSEKFDADRSEVLRRAEEAGVTRILVPGVDLGSSRSALALAESHPRLYAAIGVHPSEVNDYHKSMLKELRSLEGHPRVRAVGEIGLDYYWDTAPHKLQRRVLEDQLALAAELQLPVVIHFREKADTPGGPCSTDLLGTLQEWTASLRRGKNPLADRPGVLHSFSGTLEMAQAAMGLGFFLGVTGPVTYQNAQKRLELVAALPLECILLETDAPYLSPHPRRGKRNEPATICLIADKIACVQGITTGQVARVTSENARQLFDWD